MTADMCKLFYDNLELDKLLKTETNNTKWGNAASRVCGSEIISRDTAVVYSELAKICAIAEAESPQLVKALNNLELMMVRAVSYVTSADPDRLSAEMQDIDNTNIFSQLAMAWGDADAAMAERYTAILMALQAFCYLANGNAPALEEQIETALQESLSGASPQRQKPDMMDQPKLVVSGESFEEITFEEMKQKPWGDQTLYETYVSVLENYEKQVAFADELYEQIDSRHLKPYDYFTAMRFLLCAETISLYRNFLAMPVRIDPHDQSWEACKSRIILPGLQETVKDIQIKKELLLKIDPDLERKMQNYEKYKDHKEDLRNRVANKAQLMAITSGKSTYVSVKGQAESLQELAKKEKYAYAYVLAAKLYLLLLQNFENAGISYTDGIFDYECKRDLVNCLANYYFACYEKGDQELDHCESDIFCYLPGEYVVGYRYLQDLQSKIIEMATVDAQIKAADHFVAWMELYQVGDEASSRERKSMRKVFKKVQAKPKIPYGIGMLLLTAIWVLVGVIGTFICGAIDTAPAAYIVGVASLAALTVVMLGAIKNYPRGKVWLRVIAIVGAIAATVVSRMVYLVNFWGNDLKLVLPLMLMIYLPSIALSFVPRMHLFIFPVQLRGKRIFKLVLTILIYMVGATLCSSMPVFRGTFGTFLLAAAGAVIMFMVGTGCGINWLSELACDANKGYPSIHATLVMYMNVLAASVAYMSEDAAAGIMRTTIILAVSMIAAQIGARNNLN